MCCFLAALVFLGPRAGILVWWLINPTRWTAAFPNFIVAFLGFIFLPWTTMAYVLTFEGGIIGFDWIILGLGVLVDFSSWFGGGARRRRMEYYPESLP